MPRRAGFTLVELMITIAILSILAVLATLQLSKMIQKSNEATTKANLGIIRGAIAGYTALYYDPPGDDLASVVQAGFLNRIPDTYVRPYHSQGNHVGTGTAQQQLDSSGDIDHWWYVNIRSEDDFGKIEVNCIHTDLKGNSWTAY